MRRVPGWNPDPQDFARFLERLDPNPERAGRRYEQLRTRLIRMFSWEGNLHPEEAADETINRTVRRLSEGEPIRSLDRYVSGVARHVLKEMLRRQQRHTTLDQVGASIEPTFADPGAQELENRLNCLRSCLERMPENGRTLILSYYGGEPSGRIQHRRRLADALHLRMNALRNRALRLRIALERCVMRCLANTRSGDASLSGDTESEELNSAAGRE